MRLVDRAFAGVSGIGIFAAVTYVAIQDAGGVTAEDAPIYVAVFFAICAASWYTGQAWSNGARITSICLFLGVIFVELASFQRTIARLIEVRLDRDAPALEAERSRNAMIARIVELKSSLAATQADKSNITAALARQDVIAARTAENALARTCGKSCRTDNAAQIKLAANGVAEARQQYRREVSIAAHNLKEAQDKLAAMPAGRAGNPFANWLGIDPVTQIVLQSGTLSIGVLLLATGLLHIAARHNAVRQSERKTHKAQDADHFLQAESCEIRLHTQDTSTQESAHDVAALFLSDTCERCDNGGSVSIQTLKLLCPAWLHSTGLDYLTVQDVGKALLDIVKHFGAEVGAVDGAPSIKGIRLKIQGPKHIEAEAA